VGPGRRLLRRARRALQDEDPGVDEVVDLDADAPTSPPVESFGGTDTTPTPESTPAPEAEAEETVPAEEPEEATTPEPTELTTIPSEETATEAAKDEKLAERIAEDFPVGTVSPAVEEARQKIAAANEEQKAMTADLASLREDRDAKKKEIEEYTAQETAEKKAGDLSKDTVEARMQAEIEFEEIVLSILNKQLAIAKSQETEEAAGIAEAEGLGDEGMIEEAKKEAELAKKNRVQAALEVQRQEVTLDNKKDALEAFKTGRERAATSTIPSPEDEEEVALEAKDKAKAEAAVEFEKALLAREPRLPLVTYPSRFVEVLPPAPEGFIPIRVYGKLEMKTDSDGSISYHFSFLKTIPPVCKIGGDYGPAPEELEPVPEEGETEGPIEEETPEEAEMREEGKGAGETQSAADKLKDARRERLRAAIDGATSSEDEQNARKALEDLKSKLAIAEQDLTNAERLGSSAATKKATDRLIKIKLEEAEQRFEREKLLAETLSSLQRMHEADRDIAEVYGDPEKRSRYAAQAAEVAEQITTLKEQMLATKKEVEDAKAKSSSQSSEAKAKQTAAVEEISDEAVGRRLVASGDALDSFHLLDLDTQRSISDHSERFAETVLKRRNLKAFPDEYDFRTSGPAACQRYPRQQGDCGAGWAFAALGSFEKQMCFLTGGEKSADFSRQRVLECARESAGCAGGSAFSAFNAIDISGVCSETCYKYHAGDTQRPEANPLGDQFCLEPKNFHCEMVGARPPSREETAEGWKVPMSLYKRSPVTNVVSGEKAIQAAILTYGAVYATMEVFYDFFQYTGGVYTRKTNRRAGNHAVQLIGWGRDAETDEKYWIGENSFGPFWGENSKMEACSKEACGGTWCSHSFKYSPGGEVFNPFEDEACGYFRIRRGTNETSIEGFAAHSFVEGIFPRGAFDESEEAAESMDDSEADTGELEDLETS